MRLARWLLPPLSWLASAAGVPGEDAEGTCSTAGGPCGSPGVYHWPTQKGSVSRAGYSPHPVPDLARGPSWNWFDPFNDVIRASPLIDDEKNIFLTTVAGRIYKFNSIGVVVWERILDVGIPTVGSLLDGSLFVGTRSGGLLAIDMKSGEDRWKVSISVVGVTAADASSVFAHNGTVVAATHIDASVDQGNSHLVAVRAEDGRFLWRYQPEQPTNFLQVSSPGDGTIVFQDKVGSLYRLALADGRLIWRSGRLGGTWAKSSTAGAAVCHEGRVYFVSNSASQPGGVLCAYSVDDGRKLWQAYLPYPANQAVAAGPHPVEKGRTMVVVGIGDNPGMPPIWLTSHHLGSWAGLFFHQLDLNFPWLFATRRRALVAYDADSGRRLWHFEPDPFRSEAAAGESTRIRQRHADVAAGVNPHNDVMCLPGTWSQPVIGPDGTVYIGSQDGGVYAVRDADGNETIDVVTEVSRYELGEGFQAPLALAPGMLVAAPCGGGLRVFR